jgi:coproporphyrinogen III oxidase-like Fe-S oxidoreductase
MTNAALAIQNWVKIFNEEPEVPLDKLEPPPDSPTSQSYMGMGTFQIIKQDRLKKYWSVLGDCIEDRKEFTFQCENEDEADELKKLTWTLVFQINDIWEVYLDDLVVKANPPKE